MDLQPLFAHWISSLQDCGEMIKAMPSLRLTIVDAGLTAQIVPGRRPRIEIGETFLAELRTRTESSLAELMEGVAAGFEYDESDADAFHLLGGALLETEYSLVLLHEVFHVLCGHLDLPELSHSLALSEQTLGCEPSTTTSGNEFSTAMKRAYYAEFEADNCAILAMLQLALPPELSEWLACFEAEDEERSDPPALSSPQEIVTYRMLLLAGWQMIRLFEALRGETLRSQAAAHPFPGARLVAFIHTLLEIFAGEVLPKSDRRLLTIDEYREQRLKLFFDQVMRPALKVRWSVAEEPNAPAEYRSSPLVIMEEVKNLLFEKDATTPLGRDILALDALRPEMHRLLTPFRYYLAPEDQP